MLASLCGLEAKLGKFLPKKTQIRFERKKKLKDYFFPSGCVAVQEPDQPAFGLVRGDEEGPGRDHPSDVGLSRVRPDGGQDREAGRLPAHKKSEEPWSTKFVQRQRGSQTGWT